MMGKLGFDIVVSKLSPNDLLFSQQAVKTYDSIKGLVWYGDLYRLADPRQNEYASLVYVSPGKNSAVMFNYLTQSRYGNGTLSPIKLKGLDATKKYTIREINKYPGSNSRMPAEATFSGEYLMTIGYNPGVNTNRTSVIMLLTAAK